MPTFLVVLPVLGHRAIADDPQRSYGAGRATHFVEEDDPEPAIQLTGEAVDPGTCTERALLTWHSPQLNGHASAVPCFDALLSDAAEQRVRSPRQHACSWCNDS